MKIKIITRGHFTLLQPPSDDIKKVDSISWQAEILEPTLTTDEILTLYNHSGKQFENL